MPSYADELQTALTAGKSAEEKLRFELKKSKALVPGGSSEFVIYQDEGVGRIVSCVLPVRYPRLPMLDTSLTDLCSFHSQSMTSRLSATLWSALRYGGSSNTGGTLVYRGFQAAHLAAHPPPAPAKSPRSSLDTSRPSSVRSGSPLRAEKKKKEEDETKPKPPSLRARQSLEDLRANLGDKLRLGEEIAHELGEGMRKGVGELVGVTPIEGAEGLGPGEPAGRDPEASGAGGGAPDQLEGVDLPNKVCHSFFRHNSSFPRVSSDDCELSFFLCTAERQRRSRRASQ